LNRQQTPEDAKRIGEFSHLAFLASLGGSTLLARGVQSSTIRSDESKALDAHDNAHVRERAEKVR
jgi:hypothetical protein